MAGVQRHHKKVICDCKEHNVWPGNPKGLCLFDITIADTYRDSSPKKSTHVHVFGLYIQWGPMLFVLWT